MTAQETSVDPGLSEEEEDPSEEEPIDENNDEIVCNEEASEEEDASEEDNWKEESNEDDELHEEYADCEEESNEKDADEEIEEEPCEEGTKHHDDNLLSEAANSSSGKKRRSTDKLETSSEKRMRRDEDSKKEENTGSSGKRRRRGWDVKEGFDEETTKFAKKRKKTRWATDDAKLKVLGPLMLPDFADDTVLENLRDPEFQKLSSELLRINQKLRERELVDDQPENERSPSPPPVYNYLGIRENTREVRLRTKLEAQRQSIIRELIKKNPSFKHLSYYKPQNLCKKLYVPHKKYPGFNFIGLIVGPGGRTIQRMERQTGAKIIIRGKGYNMRRRDSKKGNCVPWEDDEVYVQIDADNQQSLDAAVKMVEKLLVPVKEETLKIKSAQLRELARLNGTQKKKKSHKVDKVFRELCDVCGDSSHLTANCPLTASALGTETSTDQINFLGDSVENPYELEDEIYGESCNVCGDPSHFTASCPLTASGPGFGIRYPTGDASFPPFDRSPHSNSAFPVIDDPEKGTRASTGNYNGMPVKEIDEAKLFVGYLPRSVNTDKLIELFLPFGGISDARVITDRATGLSRGYGFVKYADPICAAKAVARMNGYRIEGKVLAVRIAHLPPTTVKGHWESGGPALPVAEAVVRGKPRLVEWPGPPGTVFFSSFAKTTTATPLSTPESHLGLGRPGFPVPEAVSWGKPASQDWPGPPGSMLLQPFTPFTGSLVSFSPPRQILVSPTFIPGSISSQSELEQFPGYLKSFDSPAHVHRSSSSDASSQFRSAQSSGRKNQNSFNLTPPPRCFLC